MKKKLLLTVLSLALVFSCMACTNNSTANNASLSQDAAVETSNNQSDDFAGKEKTESGFYVNDNFFAFSADEGVKNFKEIEGAAYCKEAGKFKAEMPSAKDDSIIPMENVNVIFNVTFNGSSNLNTVVINGNVAADYRFIALKDNFKLDSLDMSATASDAVISGYRACTNLNGLYYKVTNDYGNVDMAEIEADYDSCQTFKDFWTLPYGEEFKGIFNFDALQISEDSNVAEIVEKMESFGAKKPKETIIEKLVMAKQLQLLSEGKIDYFVVKYYGFSETDGNYCFLAVYTRPGETEDWFEFD